MNDVFVTYRHLRRDPGISNVGGVTLAIWVDMRDPSDRKLMFAYSMCNPDFDAFNKAEGRRVAYRRLADARKGYKVYEFHKLPYTSKAEGTLVEQILDYINDHPEYFVDLNRYLHRYVY